MTNGFIKFYFYKLIDIVQMVDQNPQDSRLSEARALASQLGLFAEENEIPRDLWDALEAAIYNFYDVKKS